MPEHRSRASLIRRWTVIGSVLQVIMVLVGNRVAAIAGRFDILGTLIALTVGLLFARHAGGTLMSAAVGGALVAGVSSFVGVALAVALGHGGANVILIATLAGLVAGAIGGLIGRATAKGSSASV